MKDPFIGTVFKQTYKIESLLADGGMSRIYLAKQISLSRTVAIKILVPEYFDQDFIDLFLREARINSQINHPNIVSILDFDLDPDKKCAYLVMEYLEGGNLSEIVQQQSGLSIENINWLMGQLCSAIQCAHNLSIVHRDIKPGNIMVSKVAGDSTIVKVVDFGISKPMKEEDLKHTQLGTIVGTPGYLSPEQIQGKPVDFRSDIYALGAIVHYMATGKRPYTGQNREVIMRRQLTEKPGRLDDSPLNDYYCHILQPVIDKALAVDPDKRYQSVDALWRDYCDCIESHLPASSPSSLNQQHLFDQQDSLATSGYRLIFKGKIDKTSDTEKVKQRISEELGYSDNQLNSLFSGKRIIISQHDTQDEIKAIQKTFENLGAITTIESIPEPQSHDKNALDASSASRLEASWASTSGVFKAKPINLDGFEHISYSSLSDIKGLHTDSSSIDKEHTESYTSSISMSAADFHAKYSQSQKTNGNESNYQKGSKQQDAHHKPVFNLNTFNLETFKQSAIENVKSIGVALVLVLVVITAILPFTQNIEDAYQAYFNDYIPSTGVDSETITFGLSGNLTNDGRSSGYALRIGIETYFNAMNDAGGIHGRSLKLVAKDHLGKGEKAQKQTQQLSQKENGVFALLGHDTTLAEHAILDTIRRNKIPLIAPSSGADSLRSDPPDRYVLNFKPSYSEETETLIHYFTETLGFKPSEIGVIYEQDTLGVSGLNGVNRALKANANRTSVTYLKHEKIENVVKSNQLVLYKKRNTLKALLFLCNPRDAADYIYSIKKRGGKQVIAATSQMDPILSLRLHAMEVGMNSNLLFSQVVPMYNSYAEGVVEYRKHLLHYFPDEAPSSISLEGYLIAKMTVQALKQQGRYFSRESLINQFKSMTKFDLGIGKIFGFSEENRQANHKVWGSRVNQSGKLVAHSFKNMLPMVEEELKENTANIAAN